MSLVFLGAENGAELVYPAALDKNVAYIRLATNGSGVMTFIFS